MRRQRRRIDGAEIRREHRHQQHERDERAADGDRRVPAHEAPDPRRAPSAAGRMSGSSGAAAMPSGAGVARTGAFNSGSSDRTACRGGRRQIDQHVDEAEQQHDALDDRIVAAQDRIDGQPAEARDGEHALGHHRAADQERDADADDGHDRHRGVLQRMQEQDRRLAEALGPRGADVVLAQHLEHGRARDARDQRDVDAAERDRRQDQVLEPGPQPLGERRVALHRQPVELEREDIGEEVGDHEHRHREAEHRERHDQPVDPGAGLPGRHARPSAPRPRSRG